MRQFPKLRSFHRRRLRAKICKKNGGQEGREGQIEIEPHRPKLDKVAIKYSAIRLMVPECALLSDKN